MQTNGRKIRAQIAAILLQFPQSFRYHPESRIYLESLIRGFSPLRGLLPPVVLATSNIGYIRFHGRNRSKWYSGDSKERYDYLYSEDELKEWLPKIHKLSEQTEKVFIFFNNHRKGQAITNARMMIGLLNKLKEDDGSKTTYQMQNRSIQSTIL